MDHLDIDHLRRWIGSASTSIACLAPFPAQALSALLGKGPSLSDGAALPLPWQWLYFHDTPAWSAIGEDGHPRRGGFLPPVPLPRRMWAAGKMTQTSPLLIGQPTSKTSEVRSVDLKQGGSGALVFVGIEHTYRQRDVLCLTETQTIVYRDMPQTGEAAAAGSPAAAPAQWTESLTIDAALLFRYSALTYNGHRIHYDRDYASRVEHYPALVVHGPLLATLLLDTAMRYLGNTDVHEFSFRALRPAFDGTTIRLCGVVNGEAVDLWTVNDDGFVGMSARVTLRKPT